MPCGIYKPKRGVYHHSEETKDKIRASNVGKKRSLETRRRVGLASLGRTPWNKGTKGIVKSSRKGKTYEEIFGTERADALRYKAGNGARGKAGWTRGKKLSPSHIEKLRESHKGQINSKESYAKLSESLKKYWRQNPEQLIARGKKNFCVSNWQKENIGTKTEDELDYERGYEESLNDSKDKGSKSKTNFPVERLVYRS
jgi:hypothetical protein